MSKNTISKILELHNLYFIKLPSNSYALFMDEDDLLHGLHAFNPFVHSTGMTNLNDLESYLNSVDLDSVCWRLNQAKLDHALSNYKQPDGYVGRVVTALLRKRMLDEIIRPGDSEIKGK